MFDTMTLTKILAAACSALLVFVLGGWIGDKIYSPSHHAGDHHQAYTIDTGESTVALASAADEPNITELLATADIAKGERVFKKCAACHKLVTGENGVGPYLNGVVNRAVASVGGFAYSGKLIAVADVWNVENLDGFLKNPKSYAPGTKMSFAGLSKATDRANLIAYLQTTAQ